ncbi:response regulator [Cohnella pontilimi]|uniref:Response regulator n=1 Tax=Cohnella pontilimi TaxID=2564100 RepID=A0A4U0FH69_9BACL|nr:response regulator [Cohnella pontilimi]TJY44291.1 response regulator [Cohnella pontilimi]
MARLLLAEDEEALRMLIVDTLEEEGHVMDVACDGEEALRKISVNRYDLIILDHMMPKLTGLEVIERLRSMPEHASSRVLMLSAKNQQTEQNHVMDAGADAFMSKPFSPLALIGKVEELLNA